MPRAIGSPSDRDVRRRRVLTRAAALLAATVLAACTTSASQSPLPGGSAGSASASSGSGEPTGTLSVAFQSDIATLDPAQGYDVVSWPAERLLFETLVGYDDKANLVPVLAAAMPQVSADGLTYTFSLRTDVSFVKPDGSVAGTMTADDVVASLNRLYNPNLKPTPSPIATSFYAIVAGADDVTSGTATTVSGIQKLDDHTVSITITQPDQTFLNALAMPFGSIMPADAPSDADAITAAPVGTGPFTLQSYEPGQRATFVRNEHYWNPAGQHVATIDFRVGVEATSALQQAEAGALDIMADNPPAGAVSQIMADPSLANRRFRTPLVATEFLSLDTSGDSPLSNVQVRQAISYAIDKQNASAIAHLGQPAACILPPAMPGYDPACDPYPYDPGKAQQLLQQAGYGSGFATTLYTDTNDPDPAVAEAIQQDLAKIGITVTLKPQSFDALLGTITQIHQAPMVLIGWIGDFPDPSDFYDPTLSCATDVDGNFNLAWYCNQAIDDRAAAAKQEQDRGARIAAYRQLFDDLMLDAPWVPLYYVEQLTVVSDRVQGFFHHPAWTFDLAAYSLSQ